MPQPQITTIVCGVTTVEAVASQMAKSQSTLSSVDVDSNIPNDFTSDMQDVERGGHVFFKNVKCLLKHRAT